MLRRSLFLTLFLVGTTPFCRAFKKPGAAELSPKIRSDFGRIYRWRGGNIPNPIEMDTISTTDVSNNGKERRKKCKYNNPKDWSRYQQKVKAKKRAVKARKRKELADIAWKSLTVLSVVICSPFIFFAFVVGISCLPVFAYEMLLRCGPWAIVAFALYKGFELLVGDNRVEFKLHSGGDKDDVFGREIDETSYEADEMDGIDSDDDRWPPE